MSATAAAATAKPSKSAAAKPKPRRRSRSRKPPKRWGEGRHIDQLWRYCTGVVDGRIIAGNFTRLACQRQIDDVAKPPIGAGGERYRWSPWRAVHAARFYELLQRPAGVEDMDGDGQRLELLDFHCFVIMVICGWVYDANRGGRDLVLRRFRNAYLSVARKNGKTSLCAALGLYFLAADCMDEAGRLRERSPQVLFSASGSKQSQICRDLADSMIGEADGDLCRAFKLEKLTQKIKTHDGGFLESRSSTSQSLEGTSPSLGVVDELHLHKSDSTTRDLRGGMGARRQPLLFQITTAGDDINSYCFEREAQMQLILNGTVKREDTFAVIYRLDESDDELNPATWRKANPAMIPADRESDEEGIVSERELLGEAEEATMSNRTRNSFAIKRTNRWMTGVDSFFDGNLLRDCAVEGFDFDNLRGGGDVYLGVDFASKDDLGAVAAVRLEMKAGDFYPSKIETAARVFIPEGRIRAGGAYGQLLRTFVDEGKDVELTEGDTNDYERMQLFVEELAEDEQLNVKGIAVDKWQSASLLQRLQRKYSRIDTQEVGQGAMEQNDPMQALEQRHRDGGLVFSGSRVLSWMFGNAVGRSRPQGEKQLFKLDKLSPNAKIDAVSAIVTALCLGMKLHRENNSVLGVTAKDLDDILGSDAAADAELDELLK